MPPRPYPQPPLEQQKRRSYVSRTVANLLMRGRFGPADREGVALHFDQGDSLQIRHAGFFAVRLYLPRKDSRAALVWVGRRNGDSIHWGLPKSHQTRLAAALDAYRLVSTFAGYMVGGD